ncbi:MAG: hypothetical protein ABIP46_03500 [Polaromonas sp.]
MAIAKCIFHQTAITPVSLSFKCDQAVLIASPEKQLVAAALALPYCGQLALTLREYCLATENPGLN